MATAGDGQPYVGQIAGDDVYVRSGPSEQFYATQKLNAGDRVTVVGVRGAGGDWLKIVPPDGSFCYVAKVWIDPVPGDATAGRAKKSDLNVRAGSVLNSSMKAVLTTLNAGDPVTILGSLDDKYFKIASPPAAYLYVQKSFVTPVPAATPPQVPLAARAAEREPVVSDPITPPSVPAAPAAGGAVEQPVAVVAPAVAAPAVAAPPVTPAPTPVVAYNGPLMPATAAPQPAPVARATPVPVARPTPAPQPALIAAVPPPVAEPAMTEPPMSDPAVPTAPPTTRPADVAELVPSTRPTVVALAKAPSTRPAVVLTPRQRFDLAEVEFARCSKLPLDRQPLEGLRWRYRTLAATTTLPSSIRQTSLARVDTLNLRIDARQQLAEATRTAKLADDRQKSLVQEQQELSDRIRTGQVTTYAALGKLRFSSLQQSGATLYRLCDPTTNRTMVYLRSNDAKYAGLVDQFIGVHGQVTADPTLSLRYVTPTDAEVVDVAKVNNGVTAPISPPSLMPKPAEASAGGN